MKKIFILTLLTLGSLSSMALDCSIVKRDNSGSIFRKISKKLEPVSIPGGEKLSVDIEDAYASVMYVDGRITAMITLAPTYQYGNLSTGSLDPNGRYKLSYVTPEINYELNCKE